MWNASATESNLQISYALQNHDYRSAAYGCDWDARVPARQSISSGLCLFDDSFDHLTPKSDSLGKSWGEVSLYGFESIAVGLEVTKGHALRPSLQTKSKFLSVAKDILVSGGGNCSPGLLNVESIVNGTRYAVSTNWSDYLHVQQT